MSARRWLDARDGEAPQAIRDRLVAVLAAHPEWEALPVADAMLAAGEFLLAGVLAAPAKDRSTALDLLCADACVTYAFEAGAEHAEGLVELADRAMKGVAALV